MHSLLERQLRRHLDGAPAIPEPWRPLFVAISAAYEQADRDRHVVEQSLQTVSEEMIDRFWRLEHQRVRHEALAVEAQRAHELALLHAAHVAALRATTPQQAIVAMLECIATLAEARCGAAFVPTHSGWRMVHSYSAPDTDTDHLLRTWRAAALDGDDIAALTSPDPHACIRHIATSPHAVEPATLVFLVQDTPRAVLSDELCRLLERQFESSLREKRVAQAYHDRVELLRALTEATPDAICAKDRDGRYLSANPATAILLGRSVGQLLGRTDRELLEPTWAAREEAEDRDVVQSGQPVLLEHVVPSASGQRTMLVRKAPLYAPDGTIAGVVAIASDVTERAHMEQRLHQAEKMESLGVMAGGVAHDFNNLLTVIAGNCSLAADTATEHDRAPLLAIQDAVTRAASLTRQLLAFARREIVQPKDLDINAILTERYDVLARLLGESIALALLTSSDPLRVHIDPSQFDQMVMNLVLNARSALPNGGVVRIETSVERIDDRSAVARGLGAGRYAVLRVSDDGVGMSEETCARVFEPFFTTRTRGQGAGLGLAQVYGAVTACGGGVTAQSTLGAGSRFSLYLPLSTTESMHETAAPAQRRLAIPGGGVETILLAEDEQAVRTLARLLLERAGYRVLEARHGEDALRVAAAYDGRIDVLLSDVVMPVMGGGDLSRQLRRTRPDVRVVFMSGYSDDDIVRTGVERTACGFLGKPFSAEALLHGIRDALDAATP
jgi:PAS domain S-box-containing protein